LTVHSEDERLKVGQMMTRKNENDCSGRNKKTPSSPHKHTPTQLQFFIQSHSNPLHQGERARTTEKHRDN